MSLKSKLIKDASDFCAASGIQKSTLGIRVANDGKFFARIEAGGRLTTDLYERFQAYFSNSAASPSPMAADTTPAGGVDGPAGGFSKDKEQ